MADLYLSQVLSHRLYCLSQYLHYIRLENITIKKQKDTYNQKRPMPYDINIGINLIF